MFHDVPVPVRRRMGELEALDTADLQPVIEGAAADPRVDALVVPIGKGELVCRRVGR